LREFNPIDGHGNVDTQPTTSERACTVIEAEKISCIVEGMARWTVVEHSSAPRTLCKAGSCSFQA
jgi:hypothetical protein